MNIMLQQPGLAGILLAQILNNDGIPSGYHPGFEFGGKTSDAVWVNFILMVKEAARLCHFNWSAMNHAANYVQESRSFAGHAQCTLGGYVRR
jgi:hypothetical protein